MDRLVSTAKSRLPALGWLQTYRRDWLLPDILAGLALWAAMVPEGMAYSGIVGVPPIMGLYTTIPPLLVYALLGTSRLLVVGPDTATGLISALGVGAIAAQGTAEFNTLTSTLAVLIGVFFLLFGALRMGWVAAFAPTPVMRGFIEGLVCVTIIGQVPHLLGISGTSGEFFTKLWYVLNHLSQAELAPALTGLLSLALMLLLRRFAPKVPAALAVLVVATIAVSLLGGEARGWMWSAAFHPACLASWCRRSTSPRYRNSRRRRLPSCWSVTPRHSAPQRPPQRKAAAISILTRSCSRTDRQISSAVFSADSSPSAAYPRPPSPWQPAPARKLPISSPQFFVSSRSFY
jgi:hypothetical protein